MSTRGYFVFKYKGKYYIFYNHHDSYPNMPNGLGYKFIQGFKMLTREQIIEYIEKMIKLLIDYEIDESNWISHDFVTIEDAFLNPTEYKVIIQYEEPFIDLFIEYIYIIDLDDNKYKMISSENTRLSFNLNNIPEDFVEIFISTYEDM